MSNHPLARELVLQLLPLEGTDTLLPLPIIVNLHRRELRRPLENVHHLFSREQWRAFETGHENPANHLEHAVANAYPELSGGMPYYSNSDTRIVFKGLPIWRSEPATAAFIQALEESDGVLSVMIKSALDGWVSYQALVSLHQLTWSTDIYAQRLPALEAELAATPYTGQMIRWLAEKDEGAGSG